MKKTGTFLMILFISIVSYTQDFSSKILMDHCYGREGEFGDFDRDGDLDILMFYVSDHAYTRILENTGNQFKELESGFPIVENKGSSSNGAVNWIDFNNDGYLDVYLVLGQPFSVVTQLFMNNRDKSFTEKTLNINDLVLGSCGPSWSDIDNDGDQDLTIFGYNDELENKIKIYENDKDNLKLTAIDFDFGESIIKSRKPWGDFNNDGYLDLLVNEPIDNDQCNLAIYKNNGDKTFTKIVFKDLLGLNQDILNQSGDMRWGDYDNDGYLDILISGRHTLSNGIGITYLYKNNQGESFSKVDMESVYGMANDVSIEWGDFDNDGDLDILQTGDGWINEVWGRTRIFRNDKMEFVNSGNEDFLYANQYGMSMWGDINNDNNLDFIVMGEVYPTHDQITIYENIIQSQNNIPQPPQSLETQLSENRVILSWSDASDVETASKTLGYNIYLIHENDTVIQPNSLENGKRTLVDMGNAQLNKFYVFKDLKPGTYRWSVQSVDQSFVGSEFSPEEIFEVASVTSIDDELTNRLLNIFPNPFVSEINIVSEQLKNSVNITLMNAEGREIYNGENIGLPYKIKTNQLEKGIYVLTIKAGKFVTIRKVVKN